MRRTIPGTDLDVSPLCLGTNIFGWTIDERQAHEVLDAYVAAGGNFVDTADVYSSWVEGNSGGESESIIGDWLASRDRREDVVVATKVGADGGLGADNVREKAAASLRRLRVERIDLLYAHRDDPDTPLEETLAAFDGLVREDRVRHVGASNYSAPRLAEALEISRREGLARYVALQPAYNLLQRDEYEGELRDLRARENVGCIPYYGLARGFLTGKYRPGREPVDSRRAEGARAYMDDRGLAVLEVLDEVAAAHQTTVAAVALAWLVAQPTVVSAIASARTPEQLAALRPMQDLQLSGDELERLTSASSTRARA